MTIRNLPVLVVMMCALSACEKSTTCLAGDDGVCLPSPPCSDLTFVCDDSALSVRTLLGAEGRPPGLAAQAAVGDVVMRNAHVTIVIDNPETPHHVAPTGGSILDATSNAEGAGDQINSIYQVAGILPEDAIAYETIEIIDRSPVYVAVIVRGELEARPGVEAVTRYELRPCDRGIRARTELHHGGREPYTFFLSDGFFWGDRQNTPFVPLKGQGFVHPSLSLLAIGEAFREVPFMAGQSHTELNAAYALVSCTQDRFEAFQSDTVSAGGTPRTLLMPGDNLTYERFIIAEAGPGLHRAVNVAFEARAQMHGDTNVMMEGRVVDSSGAGVGGDERRVSLLVFEPGEDPSNPESRTPWTEVVPDAEGRFSIRLPAGKAFAVERYLLGRPLAGLTTFSTTASDGTIPDIVTETPGFVEVAVTDGAGEPLLAEVVLTPSGDSRDETLTGSHYGFFEEPECAPWLGPAHGASPGCNRVLLDLEGKARFAVPEGTFYVYATRGPFSTLDREAITVVSGETVSVSLTVEALADLLPEGVVSADFHVHSGLSFDSQFPTRDRARSLVTADLDVIAATEHDVVTDYRRDLEALGLEDEVRVMAGMEATPLILFYQPPGAEFPKTVGHFAFWPLQYDTELTRGGGPDDELVEPNALFARFEPRFVGSGVRQLNHPYANIKFGRDEGYYQAIGYDPREPLPASADSSPGGQALREAQGIRNIDHHVQEVMNGADSFNHVKYRALWFSFLNQGVLRAGTANSDSHTLGIEVLGYPRNLVLGGHSVESFDQERFNADVRGGRMVGTNGPVLLAAVEDGAGNRWEPSLSGFDPADDAELVVELRAAPWIPVRELRVYVSGKRVMTVGEEAFSQPADPLGAAGILRLERRISLSELLVGVTGDAWIVVEVGMPERLYGDVNDDGVPDTTDNNGDGVVNAADQAGLEEGETYLEPPRPETEDDPRFHLDVVAPGVYPAAYTNPFLIDVDGDGVWTAPGLE